MLIRCFSKFYKFYYTMRSRYSVPNLLKWLSILTLFAQQSILLISSFPPTEIFLLDGVTSFWHFMESILLFLPWIFGTEDFLFDAVLFLLIHIIFLIILFYGIYSINRNRHTQMWIFIVTRLFQQYLVLFFEYPLYYRTAYLIERILNYQFNYYYILALTIDVINILLIFFHQYLSAIFLIPFNFVIKSKFDMYDGKHTLFALLIRFLFANSLFYLSYADNIIIIFVIIAVALALCIVLFSFRVSTKSYVSLTAQFIDLAPLFSHPFIMLVNYWKNDWAHNLALLTLLYIIWAIVFNVFEAIMAKQSIKAFGPFIRDEFSEDENNGMPKIYFQTMTAVIRYVARNYSDPECFIRFMKTQKRTSSSKTAYTMEILRFLALFPSRREFCLKELNELTTKSNYNSFQIYLFKKALKSMLNQSTPAQQNIIHSLYRSYLVHIHLYWKARQEKRWKECFKEGFYVCFYFFEVRSEIHALLYRYIFDPQIHFLYAEFIITAYGDFETYQREITIAEQLENGNSTAIEDPWLHPMSIFNPRILQYCETKEVNVLSNSNSTSKKASTPFSSFFNSNAENAHRKAKGSPVITFVNPSKRLVPLLLIIHMLLPVSLCLMLFFSIYPKEVKIKKQASLLYNEGVETTQFFYKAASAMFLPYSLSNTTNNDKCAESFFNLTFDQINFYNSLGILSNLTGGMVYSIFQLSSESMLEKINLCELISELDEGFTTMTINQMALLSKYFDDAAKSTEILYQYFFEKYSIDGYLILTIIISIIFTFISFLSTFIQLITVLNDDVKIDYLASTERIALQLMQDSKSAWEVFRKSIPSDDTSTDTGSIVHLSEASSLLNIPTLDRPLQRNSAFSLLADPKARNHPNTNKSGRMTAAVPGVQKIRDFRDSLNEVKFGQLDSGHHVTTENTDAVNSIVNNDDISNYIHDDNNTEGNHQLNSITSNLGSNIMNSNIMNTNDDNDNHSHYSFNSSREENEENDEINDEMNIANQAIQVTECEANNEYCVVIFIFILPTLLVIFMAAILLIPVSLTMNKQLGKVAALQSNEKIVRSTVQIMNITWGKLLGNKINTTELILLGKTIQSYDNEISSNYVKEQCYSLQTVICISIETMINTIAFSSVSTEKIANHYLPIAYLFARNAVKVVYNNIIIEIRDIQQSNGICFLIIICSMMFMFIVVGVVASHHTLNGFNSLYHFPDDFINPQFSDNKKSDLDAVEYYPSNVLIITSITDTDIIYSTSDNSKQIINRGLNEILSQKLSKLFVKIPDSDDLCEYILPDKKKKIFRYSQEKVGCLTKTVLVEEISTSAVPSTPTNSREKSYSQRLIEYMPTFFAKQFGDNNISLFKYTNSFVVSCRMSSTLPAPIIDRFFNSSNHQTQNYKSVNIINVDGDMIIFASLSDVSPIVVSLFIRDLINDAMTNAKGNQDNFAIYSILIDLVPLLTISVNNLDEPFIEFEPSPNNYRFNLFHMPKSTIGITEKAIDQIPWMANHCSEMTIEKKVEKMMKKNFGQSQKIWQLPLKKFNTISVLHSRGK
ncbi:hypothetical protein TRFO_32454 [Tritrichomonas foetus]|uniref:Uncharacterized protein n=1 Tax=Tritrichomonas foetus TaxID=1144522 RepID=A0A1J4JNV4_9EUKA|nr:hypothetical protein TRFO_32454 [Tritrichomonas foetus]|eukprot:OHT00731.1 hypothetical protein TRFO_32454 [Tritrichomonas foetus]